MTAWPTLQNPVSKKKKNQTNKDNRGRKANRGTEKKWSEGLRTRKCDVSEANKERF
jgi:hypothetical protein